MELRAVLRELLEERGHVTSGQLQRTLGITRQCVWKQVRPLVELGELAIEGSGRGVRYVPGKGAPPGGGIARGTEVGAPDWHSFWTTLVQDAPRLAYVSVRHAARGTQRREHGLALIADFLLKRHLVLDFEGVERIGERFAEAVLFGAEADWVLAINGYGE
jgi:biotin operon repressor